MATDAVLSSVDIGQAIAAIAALGTAAYGLVDGSKALDGGISRVGFGRIKRVMRWLFPDEKINGDDPTPLTLSSTLETLRANWLNGTPMADQKSIAKTLIKLRLTPENADFLAGKMRVDAALLKSAANKMAGGGGEALTPQEADVAGRFDLMLTTALDEAYQRADQRYRNAGKALAIVLSVILAVVGGRTLYTSAATSYWQSAKFGEAILAGLLATPLAPVAKDLASAVQAGAKAAKAIWG
jgi:hypothetical protein